MRTLSYLLVLFLGLVVIMPLLLIQSPNLDNPTMSSESNRQPSLSIGETNGITFNENFLIQGTVWDDAFPIDLRWDLMENGSIILSSNALNTMIENLSWSDSDTKSWEFNISVNTSSVNSCSCILIVEVVDIEYQVSREKILLFINTDNSSLPTNIMHTSPESGVDWRGELVISGVSMSSEGIPAIVEWAAIQSNQASHFCNYGYMNENFPINVWNQYGATNIENGIFNIHIDTSEYEDGWWLFISRSNTFNGNNHSPISCTNIALHNKKPNAFLSGTNEINESEVAHFDASKSDDPVWGKDGLRYTFIIKTEQENLPSQVFDIGTERQWSWMVNKSGVYDVMVMVTDTSGLSNSTNMTLIVHNIAPVASASIDGIAFSNGDTIRLPDEQFWTVDAGMSTDTDNDRSGLDFIWFIDGVPVSLGEKQLLRRELLTDESKPHLLTLSATDDDGVSDFVEVLVGIEGTKSDPEWREPESMTENLVIAIGGEVNMMLIFMIMLITISLITLKITRGDRDSDIPKWVPRGDDESNSSDDNGDQL